MHGPHLRRPSWLAYLPSPGVIVDAPLEFFEEASRSG